MPSRTTSVSVRPVASGVSGGKVRIVLALMPVKGADVALERWPEAVDARFADGRAWKLLAVPAAAGPGGTRPVPPAETADLAPVSMSGATTHVYGGRRGGRGGSRLVDQAGDLWRWVMGEGATGVRGTAIWDGISDAIERAAGFKVPDELNVAAVRRADAALYYSVARARSLFRRDRTVAPAASTLHRFEASATAEQSDAAAAAAIAAVRERDPAVVEALAHTIATGRAQVASRRRYRQPGAKLTDLLSATSDASGIGPAMSTQWAIVQAALGGDHDDAVARNLRALHVATTLDDVAKEGADGKTNQAGGATLRDFGADGDGAAQLAASLQRAPQLLFALRANPTLGRLFRFVIDVEIPVEALVAATGGAPPGTGATERFVFLAATFGDAPPVWVVTKLSFAGGILAQAWPALRTEMDLSIARTSAVPKVGEAECERARRLAVTQTDGLVRLGQGLDDSAPWSRLARYDLATLDPGFAVESDVRRSRLRQALVDNAARQGGHVAPAALAAVPDPSVISRGLVVLDRWRQSAVVGEIVTAAEFCRTCAGSDPLVADAEDLATGLAIHVAAPVGETLEWRSQMRRRITYSDPRPSSPVDVEALLATLGLARDGAWRIASDGASATVPSRTRETADAPVVHVEESLCAIEGDPLALSCKTEHGLPVLAGADLAIDRVYSLATTGGDRPPPLRFGWPYKVGAGPIWLGGVSVPVEVAAPMFGRDPTLTLPSVSPALLVGARARDLLAARRFLRHEAIRPPVSLLPLHLAVRDDERVRQTGLVVILREGVEADRSSWRLVVPPHVSLDEAWRHGVFDADPAAARSPAGAPPRDGLAGVDWDEPWGGFPVYGRRRGDDARPTRAGLTRLASDPAKHPLEAGSLPRPPGDAGQPVFEARRPGRVRALPFYPDPAGEELVVALRPVAASEGGEGEGVRSRDGRPYFDGAPLVVPLRPPGSDFRETLPVAVEFRRIDAHRDVAPTQEGLFLSLDQGRRYAERHADGRSEGLERNGRRGAANVLAVRIGLCKGEHVAADCWLVPTEAKLRGWFDLPETLAMLGGVDLDASDEAAYAAIEGALGLDGGTLAKAASGLAATRHRIWLASAGLPVRERIVAAVARHLSLELRRKPIPQLAAVLTIDAAHAVHEPRPPRFPNVATRAAEGAARPPRGTLQPKWRGLDLTRYDTNEDRGGSARRDLLVGYRREGRWVTKVPQGATGVLLAGDVLVDRDATGVLEVVALCAAPQSARMDDTDRKRTDQQRIEGAWPRVRRAPAGGVSATERLERSDEVFGFKVAPDGTVELPRVEVTLLNLDGFNSRVERPVSEGYDALSLADEQLKALAPRSDAALTMPVGDAPRVKEFDPFKDRLARRLTLGLRGTSRYIPLLETIVADPNGRAPGDPSPAPRGLVSFEDAPEVWVPATQRPSPPAVHAALPLPMRTGGDRPDEAGRARWTRTCSVRVWLERPWFSSGEGERLGLVVWPPRTGKLSEERLARGLVERPRPIDGARAEAEDRPYMAMDGFVDDDLGPGGKFVTRWGADPIRAATGPNGPFLPASALVDVDKGLQDALFDETLPAEARASLVRQAYARLADPADGGVGYVTAVPMPIFPDGAENRDAKPLATILVDLVTYVPRFDPDAERWFVDVAVDPRAPQDLVEPFLRLGLVRFQAHAIEDPDVRTSAPTTAWVQVLPPREALVWRDAPVSPDGAIVVQVAGPVAARLDRDGRPREPRMRVALLAEVTLESGITVSSIVPQRAEDGNGPASEADGWVTVARGSPRSQTAASGGAWVRLLEDREAPTGCQGGARRLSVLVEELEEYPSTDDEEVDDPVGTPPMQPTSAVAKRGERVSGPRFAAKIAVPPIVGNETIDGGSPILNRRG